MAIELHMKKNKYKIIVFTIIILITAVLALARPHRIISPAKCMDPSLTDGQVFFLNRILPYLRQYKIGDIILFKGNGKVWISRIVALENNTIYITENGVIVNGIAIKNTGIQKIWSSWKNKAYTTNKPFHVQPAHVFVLSDNFDDYNCICRLIPKESIMGIVWLW